MQFNELNIIAPILKTLAAQNYSIPTPIQTEAIPPLLDGLDVLGCAQTGTGKTAAFAIPILQNMTISQNRSGAKKQIRALVVAPTRELATQIGDCFKAYGANLPYNTLVIFGGVGQLPQTKALESGTDILVATPGRLLDLIGQGFIDLSSINYFVLDEADRMLDMGMFQDVKKIIRYLPAKRQTMLFSATMPEEIMGLADSILKNPVKITITPEVEPLDIIEQSVYFTDKDNKINLLIWLLDSEVYDSVLIFSRTKHGADKIVRMLCKKGFPAMAIHGNKSQNNREKALSSFKSRETRILVATDIAARGLDISELSHVINFNLPEVPETYIHRVGRTGRAGLGGKAISFCDFEEKPLLRDIQKLTGRIIPAVEGHPYPLTETEIAPKEQPVRREEHFNGRAKPSDRDAHTRQAAGTVKPITAQPAVKAAAAQPVIKIAPITPAIKTPEVFQSDADRTYIKRPRRQK